MILDSCGFVHSFFVLHIYYMLLVLAQAGFYSKQRIVSLFSNEIIILCYLMTQHNATLVAFVSFFACTSDHEIIVSSINQTWSI